MRELEIVVESEESEGGEGSERMDGMSCSWVTHQSSAHLNPEIAKQRKKNNPSIYGSVVPKWPT